ncbi:YciK family oxidoreductase [Pseudohaliea rubra]|uniref:Putative oxidoreductase n=1 Tax=Pseudohaliea rubra DSM 19751 TaxID=1265313 RepID=A0A095VVF2_9GAMM|nr:YciK family oxidoreductase [Pseudohaliea rubra]KGE05340.1 putative oxidoreductase [Pseudohaliea rubra DSM 19751]
MSTTAIPAGYRPSPTLLAGRTVLVTGAGDGIGRAAALAYAAHGATVILLGRTVEKLEAVYDAIEEAGGAQPAIFPMDLSSAPEADYEGLAKAIGETFGRLDGLLHNASVLGERRPVANTTWKAWETVMQVNVNATFLLTRAMLPLLQAAPRASVLFTSSGVGRKGRAYWGAYAVSKFATEGLMQVLADELENTSAVRVNSLNPGATNTAMRRAAYPGEEPTGNPSPEAIMPAYLYLMGDDSLTVHGQALNAQ